MKNLQLFNIIGFLKGLYFYFPIFTFFLLAEDVSLSAIVISQVFYSLFTFIGEVPTGLFADRFGQKVSIITGYVIEAVGIILVVLFPTTIGLYIAYSLRGLAGACLSGSEEALIFETVKQSGTNNYQKIYGRFLSNVQLGFIVATASAGFAYQIWGASAFLPLIVLSAVCFLVAALVSLWLTNYAHKTGETVGTGLFTVLRDSFSVIRRDRTIFNLTIVGVLTLSGQFFLLSVYQPHFGNNNVSPYWVGAALSLGTILSVATTRYVYLLEKYMTFPTILLILNVLLGVSYILLAYVLHPVFLVALYIFMNGLFNLSLPIVSDYVNSRTRSEIRTTVLSGISSVQRFFQLLVTWGLGLSVGIFGIEQSLIIQGVYLLIGISLGYILLVRCGCAVKIGNRVE